MCVCDSDDEKSRSAKDLMVGAGRNSAHITVGSALPTPVPGGNQDGASLGGGSVWWRETTA